MGQQPAVRIDRLGGEGGRGEVQSTGLLALNIWARFIALEWGLLGSHTDHPSRAAGRGTNNLASDL